MNKNYIKNNSEFKQKNGKINIMFIIDYLYGGEGGGTERHLSYLVDKLDRKRFNPVIVAYDTGETTLVAGIRESGIDVLHIPVGRYYTPSAVIKTLKFSRLIRAMRIDIVQTYHFKSDTIGVLSAKLAGVKKIISSKRDTGDYKKKVQYYISRKINRLIDEFIVVADKVGDVLAKKENLPRHKINTIYNGVDTKKFRPISVENKIKARSRIGLSENDYVIGMVAVFRPEKNHDIFFDALKQLSKDIDNIKAVVVGNGPLYKYYKNYCRSNGIEDRVIFTGATQNVYQYLATFDVACLVPGSNEGFSNSILEKMAAGLPLVVTDIGGNAEAVMDGYNGRVVPANSSNAVAEAIKEMYNDAALRISMGQNSRKRAKEYFGLSRMVERYQNCYENLMR